MQHDWTIISKPWFSGDYQVEYGRQEDGEALSWLLDQAGACAARDFIAAFPLQANMLVGQDELISHAITTDLAAFQDVALTAGDDGDQCVTMICAHSDHPSVEATVYSLPRDLGGAGLKDIALSAFRLRNQMCDGAVDFLMLVGGAMTDPIQQKDLQQFASVADL